MTTAPFHPSTAELRATSHRQVLRAVAFSPTRAAPLELAVASASLVWDETTAPRVVAQLDVVATRDVPLEELAALDGRTGVRVAIEAGYVLEGGAEDSHGIANLGLRKVTTSRPAGTARLELASDEALADDASPAVNAPVTAATTAAAIVALLNQTISPAPAVTITATGPAVTVDPVTDRWATMADLADRIGAKVYDDGTRRWSIAPTPALAEPAIVLEGGTGGTLTDTDDATDRSQWSNYVQHVYEWRDAAGNDQRITATALVTTGPYAVTGDAGKRITIDYRNVQTTQAAANAAAAAVLGRQLSRSRSQTVTAIAAWWLRPGHTARVSSVDGTLDRLVSRIAFRWPAGLMDVTTRLPENTNAGTVATTTPPAAPPTADPAPPARQTYTSTWTASSAATYRGNGTKRTDLAGETAHGYYDGTNTNQTGVFLFTAANSTGDETGKTITQALTGAVVTRVRFRGFATWWYSKAGGTGRLGWANLTALPATYTGARPYVTVAGWPRDSWRWAELTSSALHAALAAGSCRAVTSGPGATTDRLYYGKLSAAGGTLPQLEITYAK